MSLTHLQDYYDRTLDKFFIATGTAGLAYDTYIIIWQAEPLIRERTPDSRLYILNTTQQTPIEGPLLLGLRWLGKGKARVLRLACHMFVWLLFFQ